MPLQDLERLEWSEPPSNPRWQYANPAMLVYLIYRGLESIFTAVIDRPNANAQAKETNGGGDGERYRKRNPKVTH